MSASPPRRIWLCADDYGISPGVNRGIRDLIERKRLNATSVMVVGPAAARDEIAALQAIATANEHCAIGLHAVLTAPFHPLTMHFKPLAGGRFLPLSKLLRVSLLRRLDGEIIRTLPANEKVLSRCHPVYEELPGWQQPTEGVRAFDDLPAQAQAFIQRVEKLLECPVDLISVGPEREQIVIVNPIF